MKPQWDAQLTQLRATKTQWDTLSASLADAVPIQQAPGSIPKQAITDSLADIVEKLERINERSDIDGVLVAVHQQGLVNTVNALVQSISTVQQNRSPQYFQQIIGHLWGMESILIWFLPQDTAENMARRIGDKNFIAQIRRVEKAASDLKTKADMINAAATKTTEASSQIEKLLEIIRGAERESGNAKTNSQANAAAIAADKEKIAETLKELSDGLTTQKKLSQEIDDLKQRADETLEGASKVGLARSFADRRKQLTRRQFICAIGFILGIVGLIFIPQVAIQLVVPKFLISEAPQYVALTGHVIIAAPLIWFTWFCAIQYSSTTRLMEDYAFKEAAALSFVGYSREISDDPDMLKKLRDSAIKSFGANPTRVLGKHEPVTPAHSLLESTIEKVGFDKVVAALTNLQEK